MRSSSTTEDMPMFLLLMVSTWCGLDLATMPDQTLMALAMIPLGYHG
jgi:hypothetical protein